ncbi:MAG: SIMPL domain-containing protein [Caulobacterales bacterium]
MLRKKFVAMLLVVAPLGMLGACGDPTLLTVNASASTRTAPDLAIVSLGVIARGANARAAQEAQSTRMDAVLEAARAAGVAAADVQTVGYSLEPQYAYVRGAAPRITGYVSRNIVTLRVSDLSAVSRLIDATVAEGANELQGIQFTFKDIEASREQAIAQAISRARARAQTYAEAADMRVVKVRAIIEPGSALAASELRRDGYLTAPQTEQSANAAINPGELDNQASVTVVFELR